MRVMDDPLPFEANNMIKVTAQQHDIEEIILRQRMYIKMKGKWFEYNYVVKGEVERNGNTNK